MESIRTKFANNRLSWSIVLVFIKDNSRQASGYFHCLFSVHWRKTTKVVDKSINKCGQSAFLNCFISSPIDFGNSNFWHVRLDYWYLEFSLFSVHQTGKTDFGFDDVFKTSVDNPVFFLITVIKHQKLREKIN